MPENMLKYMGEKVDKGRRLQIVIENLKDDLTRLENSSVDDLSIGFKGSKHYVMLKSYGEYKIDLAPFQEAISVELLRQIEKYEEELKELWK